MKEVTLIGLKDLTLSLPRDSLTVAQGLSAQVALPSRPAKDHYHASIVFTELFCEELSR